VQTSGHAADSARSAASVDDGSVREYRALIWTDDDPGKRLEIQADSLDDAKRLIEAEYGDGHVISLWSDEDAGRPR